MAYLIHYCRAPGRLTATMSLGTARETLELVRCLAAGGFTVSGIRCTSRAGRPITLEQLEARTRPERPPLTAEQLEAHTRPERPPRAVEQLEDHTRPVRPPSAVSDMIVSLIKRHSVAGGYL